MKWKIGAVLMALVFCLAIVPPLVSGAGAWDGIGGLFRGSGHELVVQAGNEKAIADGEAASFGSDASAAVYRSENDDLMVPASGFAKAMELEFKEAADALTFVSGKTEVTVPVGGSEITGGKETVAVSSPATNTDGTLFVPAEAVAQAFGWGYAEDGEYAVVTTKKEIKDKTVKKLAEKAEELLGVPRAELLKNSLIFRADPDCVVKNGEQTDLVDEEGNYEAPMVANEKYFLPAKAAALALGGSAEPLEDGGVKLTVGKNSIELTADSEVKLNGKKYKSEEGDVLNQDDVTYISASLLSGMLGYKEAGEGNLYMIGTKSFANAESQIAYMTALGETLPDRRPDIPKADHYVALTFDDGPTGGSSGLTVRLLNGLKERGAHATFFMCGYRIKDFHTHMERYLAEGHELANHTMDHPGVLTKKAYDTIVEQIDSNSTLIESYCGEKPTLFRPVGGAINDDVKKAAKETGLPIINWSVDTLDWKYRDAARIKSVIVNEAKDGDIVLMHDLRDCTLEGVLGAIDALQDEGYAFVTVSELARVKGVSLEPGEVYTNLRDSTIEKIKNGTYEAHY